MITYLKFLALSLGFGSITRNVVMGYANSDIGASVWGQGEGFY